MPGSFSQLVAKGRALISDPLYRGTLLLLINSGLLAALGFAFWTLAAREYPASTVGSFSGLNSGIGLVSAISSLGLQNMVTRHIASSASPRGLMVLVVGAITLLGGALCAIVVLAFGSHLPASLHLEAQGWSAVLFTALVIVSSLNGVLNAGLVAIRAPWAVLWTNLVGAVARVVALFALASLRSSGLILALGLGLFLSTALSVPPLVAKTPKGHGVAEAADTLRKYLSTTISNYIATIFGILPGSAVPLIVIAELGAARTAPFSLALLVSGFLNIIPSTAAQVLFAEASRRDVSLSEQLRKAIRAIYAILVPLLAIVVLAAPFIMRLFGASYATQGASALRILSLAALVTAGNYLVDSILIATDRGGAYLFMNAANAALVLGLVSALLDRGITGGAIGYAVAQAASLLLGLAVTATGWRKEISTDRTSSAAPSSAPGRARPRSAESIDTSAVLSERLGVSGIADALRSVDLSATRPFRNVLNVGRRARLTSAGEVIYLGIVNRELSIDTKRGRMVTSAPLVIAVSGYSGWISSLLIPSLQLPDLLAGCWEALSRLGGLPRHVVWDGEWPTSECEGFFTSLGVNVLIADEEELQFINAAHRYLAEEFFRGGSATSFGELNRKLAVWLQVDNSVPSGRWQAQRALAGVDRILLSMADRQALIDLPPRPSACTWRFNSQVGDQPFVRFGGNEYEVHPALTGQWVVVTADTSHVRVIYGSRIVAAYKRAWGNGVTVRAAELEHAGRRRLCQKP